MLRLLTCLVCLLLLFFLLVLILLFFLAGFFVLFVASKTLPVVGRVLFERYGKKAVEFEVKFMLFIILGVGLIAESVNVHAALIVFTAGLIFSGLMERHEQVVEKIRLLTFGFLAPIFFPFILGCW